jgi:hypothetical protein
MRRHGHGVVRRLQPGAWQAVPLAAERDGHGVQI